MLISQLDFSAKNSLISLKTEIHQIFIESEPTHSGAFMASSEWPISQFQSEVTMKTLIHVLPLVLILYSPPFFAQKVGINIDIPVFDLDIRGTDDANDGGELQLATPNHTNFLRFFSGRLNDHHPFMAFHDDDTFHIVTTLPDWSTYTRRMTILPTGQVGIGNTDPQNLLDIRSDGTEGYGTIVLGLISDISNRPILQFSEWETALPNSGMAIEYNGSEANQLNILGTDALSKFSFTTTGRLGIGVSTPEARLQILGGQFNLSTTEGDLNIGNPAYRLAVGVQTSGMTAGICRLYAKGGVARMIFGSDNADVLTIDSTNRVGVGTSLPNAKFHVFGSQGNLAATEGDVSIGTLTRRLGIGVSGSGIASIHAKGGLAKLVLGSDEVGIMIIDSANHVGIGTGGGPILNRLDVRSDGIADSSTIVVGLISDVSNRPVLQFSSSTIAMSTSGMAIEYRGIGSESSRRLNIRGTDVLPKVTFTDAGNVGIATESPNELLEIGGNGRIFIGDGGGESRKGLFINAGLPGATYVVMQPYDHSTGTNMDLYIPGNVGIGTTTPQEKLTVTGNICYSGSIGACSDARYKTQIEPLYASLQRCLSLHPSTYYWKREDFPEKYFSDALQIGLIAQEVHEVLPELIIEGRNGYLSVDYAKLSVVLLAALQEQQKIIDQQQKKLLSLEKRIDQVERSRGR